MTTPALLPCPFCGEMPAVENTNDYVLITCGDINTAIAAWNTRAAPRWIPVTERLPEENGDYLVVMNVRGVPTRAVRPYLNGWRYCEAFPVTHWMPLPLPPKEVE